MNFLEQQRQLSQQPVNQPVNQQVDQAPGVTQAGRGATNFFSDEQEIYDNMLNDGVSDDIAKQVITKKRQTQLKDITQQESQALIKMREMGIDSQKAVSLVRKNRDDNLPLYKKALKFVFDASVGATGMATEQVGRVGGFLGSEEMQKQGEEARMIAKRTTGDSAGAKFGEAVLGTGEMFAVGPKKMAPSMLGRTAQGAITGGIIGAADPILEKGKETTIGDVAKGGLIGGAIGAVATPVLEKAVLPIIGGAIKRTIGGGKQIVEKGVKYGTAGKKGGLTGVTKSVTRDIKRPFTKIRAEGIAPDTAAGFSTRANRFTKGKEKAFQKMTGKSTGEWATERGMTKTGDRAVEEASEKYIASMREADDALRLIDGSYKITKGVDYMKIMLDDLSTRLGKTLSKDTKRIKLLLKKYDLKGLTQTEINKVKRVYARNHKYSFVDAGGEAALKSKNLQDGVRKWQFQTAKEQGFKNLSEINKTTQGWRFYADNLADNIGGKGPNNAISLTDWVALSGGEPTNVALFLGKKVGELPGVKEGIIKTLGKQTKPSIIKADKMSIFKSNLKKENVNIRNILRDRTTGLSTPIINKPKPLLLKAGTKKPIITPQTKEKAIIQQSKIGLKTGVIKETSKKIDKKVVLKSKVGYNKDKLLSSPAKMTTKKITEANKKTIISDIKRYQKEGGKGLDEYLQSVKKKFGEEETMKLIKKAYSGPLTKADKINVKLAETIKPNKKAIVKTKKINPFKPKGKPDNKVFYHMTDTKSAASIVKGKGFDNLKSSSSMARNQPISGFVSREPISRYGDVTIKIIPKGKIKVLSAGTKKYYTFSEKFKLEGLNELKGRQKIVDSAIEAGYDLLDFGGEQIVLNNKKFTYSKVLKPITKPKSFNKVSTTKNAKSYSNKKGFISPDQIGQSLKQTKDLARDKYDISFLKKVGKIGEGSDRVVYDIGNNQVLKVAKNTRGLDQNLGALSTDLQKAGIIPKVHEVGKDFVRMDRVRTFTQLTKTEQKIVNNLVKDISKIRGKKPNVAEIDKILKKYGWEDLGNLDYQTFGWGDIKPSNLSVVNGKPILLDEGTINLVSTSSKYKNKVIKKAITAGAILALMQSAIDGTLYKIGERWIGGDILKSNTLKENQEFLTPRG